MAHHTIRKATPEDAKYISLLAKINFSESFGNLFSSEEELRLYIDKKFSEEKMKASIENSENVFWIAYVQTLPVGFAKLKKDMPVPDTNYKEAAELQKLYILKEYRAEGNGNQLKVDFFEELQKLNLKRVWIKELHTDQRALNFYETHDFHKHHTQSFSIGKEDFVFNILMKTS
ncbi:acetyltransferase (GNAT) family protein [Kordia periserrulae]|uniref:Acetyltransferase (GNAT) family protein n=1 Tax=Kordia periserrulae TaxID=701523 RepID=A0A2T6BTF7_9FLAO|nr:GNAT family N-acetyltransferase [Kordia periserrulae]PTX59247.1 acetyltransferase (GNAT) family protein [Kordia periserrulae]